MMGTKEQKKMLYHSIFYVKQKTLKKRNFNFFLNSLIAFVYALLSIAFLISMSAFKVEKGEVTKKKR